MLGKKIVISVALSVVMAGALVHAQEAPGFQKGDRTLMLGGSGGSDKTFDVNYMTIHAGSAWFMSDNVSLEVRQELTLFDVYGLNAWNGSTRVGLDYVMSFGAFSPYMGGNIGYIYGDNVKDQFVAGPDLGVRYFVNDTTFISLTAEYQVLFEDANEAADEYNDGRFVYIMGLGVKW